MVAVRLAVSVLVIVCTTTGAPPAIGTPPTNIWRLEAIRKGYPGALPGDLSKVEPGIGCRRITVSNGCAQSGREDQAPPHRIPRLRRIAGCGARRAGAFRAKRAGDL